MKKRKVFRKAATILLSCLMILSAAVTAFGAEIPLNTPYDLTVESLKGATQIDLYRIVAIDESTTVEDTLVYTLNTKYQDVYDALGAATTAEIEAKTNADILDACQAAKVSALTPDMSADSTDIGSQDSYTFEGLDMGYYYVVMTGPDGTIYNPILWTVPTFVKDEQGETTAYADSTVVAKAHNPNVEKVVKEGTAWVEKANADIGDIIDYKLTVDVPKYAPNIADADVTYKLVDEMDKGLTFLKGEDIVVKGFTGSDTDQGTVISTPFQTAAAAVTDAATKVTTLTMEFDYADIKTYAYITVEYKAMLNSDAQLNETGNKNTVTFVYSDNAYDITDVNDTKQDTTTVFTYGLDLLKAELGNDHIVLEGAKFTLKKGDETFRFIKNADGTYTALSASLYNFADGTATPKNGENGLPTYTGVVDTVVSDANGKILIKGLDAGDYVLTETEAPEDYFIIEKDISFTVTGESHQTAGLTGNVTTGGTTGNEAETAGIYYKKTIYNSTEYVMPETGDKGVVVMTVWGVIMIITACALLWAKRKPRQDR